MQCKCQENFGQPPPLPLPEWKELKRCETNELILLKCRQQVLFGFVRNFYHVQDHPWSFENAKLFKHVCRIAEIKDD
eukprot:2916517-Amphidinium_carterae.1